MLDCLIMGDSIAQGISNIRTECVAYVKQGINSYNWNNKFNYKDFKADTTIISLGSNDTYKVRTFNELIALRQSVDSKFVFWIMPANKPDLKEIIEIIANNFGDTILSIPQVAKDGIHPTQQAYKELAERTRVK